MGINVNEDNTISFVCVMTSFQKQKTRIFNFLTPTIADELILYK